MPSRQSRDRPSTQNGVVLALVWLVFALTHGVVFINQFNQANYYRLLPGSQSMEVFQRYGIGYLPPLSLIVVVVYLALGTLHALALLQMIINSLKQRRLAYFRLRAHVLRTSKPNLKSSCFKLIRHQIKAFLSVDGAHFDVNLQMQEVIETGLQTYQVYRVNQFAERLWIKRLYTATLVLRCWWVPFIHARYRNDTRRRRFLCVLSDCLLDFTASLVVPIALAFDYTSAITPGTTSISMRYLYDDRWIVKMTSEYPLMFASSWIDIVSLSFFTISLLVGMQAAKELLEMPPTNTIHPIEAFVMEERSPSMVALIQKSKRLEWCRTRLSQVPWSRALRTLLIVWGIVLTAFHFRAELRSVKHPSCPVVLLPWSGISRLSCPLLVTDCSKADISGSKSEIQALWEPIELGHVLRLVIRHCPELEIPASIDRFIRLKSLKVYNSTVVRWDDASATIKSATHPLLHSLQFVRTNFTGSVLPPGLWSAEFPRGVTVIEFCITNLAELPALVASRWPQKLRLTWEASPSSSLFPLLLEMNLTHLSLARNDLVSIPDGLLEVSTLVALSVAHTPMTALPSNVSLSSTLEQLSIVESTVSEMPSWFYDDLLARPRRWMSENLALFAGGSLYCQAIATRTIKNGGRIVCVSTHDEVSYPLDQEDAQSALNGQV